MEALPVCEADHSRGWRGVVRHLLGGTPTGQDQKEGAFGMYGATT